MAQKIKFSIGYNQDLKFFDILDNYREHVESVYFPAPAELAGSGRLILQKSGYPREIIRLMRKCADLGIDTQLLMNATCMGIEGARRDKCSRVIEYIRGLYISGLKSVVLANPIYITEVRKHLPGIKIESSVNAFVRTVEHAQYLKRLGVDTLTVDRDINRNIPLIKKIKRETGLEIKVMLNEGCLKNCPFRVAHYNILSHADSASNIPMSNLFDPDRLCRMIYKDTPEKVFSVPFIPPEGVRHYLGIADHFKISTRGLSTLQVINCLKIYIKGDFEGNLLEILDCPGLAAFSYLDYRQMRKSNFFRKMLRCSGECASCKFCFKLAKQVMVLNLDWCKNEEKLRESKKAIKIMRRRRLAGRQGTEEVLLLGKAYCNLKRYAQAMLCAKKVLRSAPGSLEGFILLGRIYEETGKLPLAAAIYKKALKKNPSLKALLLNSLRIGMQLGDHKLVFRNLALLKKHNFNIDIDKGFTEKRLLPLAEMLNPTTEKNQ
ncbi:MAG: U32 family peptidase [Candidatus Omnitrophica bacterium]|nr:U32 family peptidase [Candidatus Omnitrophota bacterium]